jgi:hypothetical protein
MDDTIATYSNDLDYAERLRLFLKLYECTEDVRAVQLINQFLDLSLATNEYYFLSGVDDWVRLANSFFVVNNKSALPDDTLQKLKNIFLNFIQSASGPDDFYDLINAIRAGLLDKSSISEIRKRIMTFMSMGLPAEFSELTLIHEVEGYIITFEEVTEYFDVDGKAWLKFLEEKRVELENEEEEKAGYDDDWKDQYYAEKEEVHSIDDEFSRLMDR